MSPQQESAEKEAAGERFHRLMDVFHQALALPPSDRPSFLIQACGGDHALLADVSGMLQADTSVSLLDANLPAIAHEVFASNGGFTPFQVGPYRLTRVLGEGGMGIVYLAERDDVGNPVAVKLLRDASLSPARRERFLSEQRLLAPLIHPSIARFYDAGTLEDGTPWFAMEYVDGIPVTQYCRQNQSNLQQRLELFQEICSAVQYAHERAIIHRDLKPSNILVKPDGEVRLLDFGIAKQLSDLGETSEQTQTLRLLTPSHAAPEQIRGGTVGVFTDVYALGVILYELLAGRLPFDHANRSPGEIEHAIAEEEPLKPSAAAGPAEGVSASREEWADLDVLCLTALNKDPQRRYRSAEEFRRDATRFLQNEPLEARAPSSIYRLRKFLRRHARPVVASAAVLALLVGLVTFFVIRLARAKNDAVRQAARSERIKEFMQHLFDNGQAGPSVDLRATDVLDHGAQQARMLDHEPAVQGELFEILGESYQKLGKYDRAEPLMQTALTMVRKTFGSDSQEAAEAMVALGSVLSEEGKTDPAFALIRDGYALQRKLLPPDDMHLAVSRMQLGRALVTDGKNKDAIALLEGIIPRLSQPGAPDSSLFMALDALGTAYFGDGQYARAEPIFQRAITLGKQIYSPNNPLIAEEFVNLGSLQYSLQKFSVAEQYYRSGLAATQAWYGPEHVMVASELMLLGQTLVKENRLQEADSYLKQALAIHERVYGNSHDFVLHDLNALGISAQKQGHFDEAEADFRKVLAVEEIRPHKTLMEPMQLNNLADLKRQQGQLRQAEELSRKAIKAGEQILPAGHYYSGIILFGLGKTLLQEKRFAEAETYLTQSYEILRRQGNPSMPTLIEARKLLRSDYAALGKNAEARALGPDPPSTP